jgi:hypothetical protein
MKSWKLQKFFGDLVYDLRNRGLLPVVVLLLVALVAIPVVISRGGSSSAPIADTAALQEAVASAPEAQSAVVAYEPGLRKYQDRLDKLSPKDPFEQQFSAAVQAATELSGTVSGGGGATDTPTPTDVSGDTGSTDTSGDSTSKKKTKKKKKKAGTAYVSYQTDVMVGEASAPLQSFTNVAPLTPLPSETAPVLIYLGPNAGGQYALFLVSNKVSDPTGPGVCIPAPDDCSLLALGPGQTEDMTYNVDGKAYRIQVAGLRRVTSSTPPG